MLSRLSQITAKKRRQYDIRAEDDVKDCCITTVVATKDGRRLLADHSNSKVKMFPPNMELIFSLKLDGCPFGIAIVSGKEDLSVWVLNLSHLTALGETWLLKQLGLWVL